MLTAQWSDHCAVIYLYERRGEEWRMSIFWK